MNNTGSSNPTTDANPKKGGIKTSTIIVAAVITALLIVIVALWISSNNTKAELVTSEQLKAEAEQKVAESENSVLSLNETNDELEDKISNLEAQIEQLAADTNDVKNGIVIDSLIALADSLQAQLENDTTRTDLQTQIVEMQTQLEEMKVANAELQAKLDAAKATPGAATDELTEKGGGAEKPIYRVTTMDGHPPKGEIWVCPTTGKKNYRKSDKALLAQLPAEYAELAAREWPR